jgi:transducin (beta)-like 1
VRNGTLLTLDQGIPAHVLAEQANGAVQEPPPKKTVKPKRKTAARTNGVVEPRPTEHVNGNGDAMDVEPNGATHVTNSVRAESELPLSTLSIGHSTEIQTEVVADLGPRTTFVPGLRDAERVIEHTSWGPPEAPVLLTAGRSVLNINVIAQDGGIHSTPAVETVDLKPPMNKYRVTALAWNSSTEMTVSAREECVNETGEKMMADKLVKITDAGENSHVISSAAGLVNTLRWNREKELLLSISTDGDRGSIKIWKNDSDAIPAWTDFTNTVIFDALWISDSAFVVCGIQLFKVYEIGESLTTQRTLDTQVSWERLKYDTSSGIVAALGLEGHTSHLGILHPNDPTNLQTHAYPDEYPTDIDFRSGSTNGIFDGSPFGKSPSPPALLATCSMSGAVRIWDANAPFKCLKRLPTIDNSQAFQVAFSPDGALLAAAGPDAVTVWDVEKREVPTASWRARDWTSDKWDPGVDGEFALGWDPDSSRLSIALGNQVSLWFWISILSANPVQIAIIPVSR